MDAADGAAGLVEMVNGGRATSAAPPLTRSRSTAGVLDRLCGRSFLHFVGAGQVRRYSANLSCQIGASRYEAGL